KSALRFAAGIEAGDYIAAGIDDLAAGICAKPRQRVVQDRRCPGGIERWLLYFVRRRRLLEVGIGTRCDERIVAVHRLLQDRARDRLLLVRIFDSGPKLRDRIGAVEIAVRIDMRGLRIPFLARGGVGIEYRPDRAA